MTFRLSKFIKYYLRSGEQVAGIKKKTYPEVNYFEKHIPLSLSRYNLWQKDKHLKFAHHDFVVHSCQ